MGHELKEVLMILLEPRSLQRGYFEASGIRLLMNDHLQRGRDVTARIWRLLMFELWHRNFLETFTKPAGLFSQPLVADSRPNAAVPSLSASTLAVAPSAE
jgi:hypothetical protein